MALKVLDLFCGAGGFSRGFEEAGFEIIGGLDNYSPCAEAFRQNFPRAVVIEEDIKSLRSEDIVSALGEEPDVIIGGPPCEPFTAANFKRRKNPLDRLYDDPIGTLVLHFIRIVGDLRPKVFVMENVPQILEDGLAEALKYEFRRVGFKKVFFNILRAEDYGNPSRRTRVFISNVKLKPKRSRKRVVVIEAIGDLPEPDTLHDIPDHDPVPVGASRRKRIARLRFGQALVRYMGAGGKVMTNWIRLHPYRLAPTVMGKSRFVHPYSDRLLTVRENARLMSFPDHHVFYGGRDTRFDQVGEAVPVCLARSIAVFVKEAIESGSV